MGSERQSPHSMLHMCQETGGARPCGGKSSGWKKEREEEEEEERKVLVWKISFSWCIIRCMYPGKAGANNT